MSKIIQSRGQVLWDRHAGRSRVADIIAFDTAYDPPRPLTCYGLPTGKYVVVGKARGGIAFPGGAVLDDSTEFERFLEAPAVPSEPNRGCALFRKRTVF
jgi:hypothetical protein